MNSSIIPLQLILVSQICIYLPSPLMIDPPMHKRAQYAPDLLPAAISVASENYVSTLTNPYDTPNLPPSYGPNTLHIFKKYLPLLVRVKRLYCCNKHGQKYATKRPGSFAPNALIKTRHFIIVMGFPRLV